MLGELVPPRTLQEFNMKGYTSVDLPACFMNTTLLSLSAYQGLSSGMRKCNNLPSLGQLHMIEMDSIMRI